MLEKNGTKRRMPCSLNYAVCLSNSFIEDLEKIGVFHKAQILHKIQIKENLIEILRL